MTTLAVAAAACAAVIYGVAIGLAWPNPSAVPAPPAELHASAVAFPSASGTTIHGWLSRGDSGRGAVLLLHGVHASRVAMLERHRFLAAAGYTVLSIDFQSHGESLGSHITFGYLESKDAAAALAFLRTAATHERIAVVGVSMGGAALLLAEPPLAADAVVLEQVYPTILEALDNRLRIYLGPLGGWVEWPLAWAMEWHLGIGADQLRPIERLAGLHVPLLIIGGDADRHTTIVQTRAMFDAASEPKQLWIVPGAEHVDLSMSAGIGEEYRRRILDFLGQSIGGHRP